MKDVTRIHIAKVSYDIELDAKKSLEKYLENLEAYADDNELLNDIEIRITELLTEQGVKPGGVISASDVTAIRHQLGEPKEFMADDDGVVMTEVVSKDSVRKLYRNLDNVMVGGVLSGIASYFGIKPLWTRLIFLLLTIITSGLMLFVYILLWAIIPPAKTAADKLHMQGRPVTLASIRELNETPVDEYTQVRNGRIRRLVAVLIGLACIALALTIVAIYITVWLHNTYTINNRTQTYFPVHGDLTVSDPIYLGAYIASGVLLVVLCVMGTLAAFKRKLTKRIVVSGLIILASIGLIVGGAYGYELYNEWQINQQAINNTKQMQVKVPDGFNAINALVADIPAYIDVTYTVDPSVRSITFKSTKGLILNTSVTDKVANITFNPTNQPAVVPGSSITIYGPELETITTKGTHLTYQSNGQNVLSISAQGSAVFLDSSSVTNVSATLKDGSNLIADSSSIESTTVNVTGASYVRLGTIKSLTVSNPDVCAVDTQTSVQVHSIRDSTYTHNGTAIASTQSFNDVCMVITIDPQQTL